ncbi:MAG: thiol:disulfide interchange protein DsbA/DsbL [Chitinophagaceae bacterium]|nr:thiol:disulfide interchange protein DsbA/DsbL [Polaromonas sp.]
MQRRAFSIHASGAAAATAATAYFGSAAMLPVMAQAQGKPPQPGTDYLVLDKPATPEVAVGKIEVVEFFWYSCQHCNKFEPQLDAWSKTQPADVVLRRIPVAFRPDFEPQQRLYFVLEAMGKVAELHKKVFAAIHVDKEALNTAEQVANWAEKQGINKAKFVELYNSFPVATKARKSTLLQDTFKVDGVPALGVAGKYFTSGSLAQSMERALLVASYLVDLTRQSSPAKASSKAPAVPTSTTKNAVPAKKP